MAERYAGPAGGPPLVTLDHMSRSIPRHSLTAILPITPQTMNRTQMTLLPFLAPSNCLREIILVCPDFIATDVRRILQRIFVSTGTADQPDVSLHPWIGYMLPSLAVIRAIADVSTKYVLLLDESGLFEVEEPMRSVLLSPPDVHVPFGPNKLSLSASAYQMRLLTDAFELSVYHLPPFVVPTSLAASFNSHAVSIDLWLDFAIHLFIGRREHMGGDTSLRQAAQKSPLSIPAQDISVLDDNLFPGWKSSFLNDTHSEGLNIASPASKLARQVGNFVFFLPTLDDLVHLAPLICKMASSGDFEIQILVYPQAKASSEPDLDWEAKASSTKHCSLAYNQTTGRTPLSFSDSGSQLLVDWLGTLNKIPDVIVALQDMDALVGFLLSEHKKILFLDATVVRIPRFDLQYTEWMSSLTLLEWKNWHLPRVDISIIAKDRPQSLIRLMNSLATARYFGDRLDLRVNVEQNCDEESLRIAESLTWPHGRVFVHHRVIRGGLLPAVVESWYPHNNDSYGLLLEDDIELSPLYYAWIKMAVLRYRYGNPSNRIPRMFGISLYQQKNLELLLEGRQPFNPRSLFSTSGLPYSSTPYLSQIPCSWGAVYFPEHWREFHEYLTVRLSELAATVMIDLEDDIVPDVRSNYWSKSWKKFFIELVYLRGYVMLYPNYHDFMSLSTNHLEVGSHVKIRSQEKQDLFLLPLMPLNVPGQDSHLLELPENTLPELENLPVLNLTGSLTSLEALIEQGNLRRTQLIGCDTDTVLYNVRALFCLI
ncbi:hypothetical protein B0H34DRAFT_654996 [Crassisporium funariophilum]|nr:hypothetical protein B0H34DRAFT_654996 [Crassisporium funariophilum]